jgi:cytoskeletal protein CcmA (bactofilin family)
MKHLKWLGLAVVVAMALIAFPAYASAEGSVFCEVQESPCPSTKKWSTATELDFTLKSGTSSKLEDTSGNTLDTCTGSTAKGKLEKDENVTGPIESLTWSGCAVTTTTLKAGKLEVEHIAGTHNGTVKADGTIEVTINTVFFGSCIYGYQSGATLGELKEGKPATFVVNSAPKKLSGLCPTSTTWTAEYTLTESAEKTLSVEVGTKVVDGSVFCATQESPCPEANRWVAGTELDFTLKSGTSAILEDTSGNTLDTCTGSTAKGKLEKDENVTGPIESLTWSGCAVTTTTLKAGKLEVEHIAGTHNGTVKADGTIEVTINTVFFGSCIYGYQSGATLGELKEGKPATFVVNSAPKKLSGLCPTSTTWTAEYTLTEPKEKTLSVELGTAKSVFCTTQESPCPEANRWVAATELDFTLKSGTSALFASTAGEELDKCSGSTAKWKLEELKPVKGPWEALTWSGCSFETTTTLLGKFLVQSMGTHNGTVKASSESRITINGGFFGSCLYGVEAGADLGELKEGKPATLAINAVVKKQSGSAAACPETAKWTAEYTLTEPKEKTLSVEAG